MKLPFIQAWKYRKNTLYIFFDLIFIFSGKTRQLQVFCNRQVVKQASALGNMRDAQLTDHFVGSIFKQVLALKCHPRAFIGRNHAGNGLEGRTFTGPVGTDNTDDLAFVDFEVQPVQGFNIAIGNT